MEGYVTSASWHRQVSLLSRSQEIRHLETGAEEMNNTYYDKSDTFPVLFSVSGAWCFCYIAKDGMAQ